MYGAIIGELSGSIYEYSELKDKLNKVINLNRRFTILSDNRLIKPESFYGDDTILTVAILDAIISNNDYGIKLREYVLEYGMTKLDRPDFFELMFSPGMIDWAKGNAIGTSTGNGSAMRISSVGYLFNDLNTVMDEAKLATIPSHNTIEAVNGAQAIASSIYLLRNGYNKIYVRNYLIDIFGYNFDYSLEDLQKTNIFTSVCSKTVPKALFTFLYSNTYEETIRNTISIGGDTDTNACIAGSLAEAYYGVPLYLVQQAKSKLPDKFKEIIDYGYTKIKKKVI